jgi:FAD/FMN-containing dehydrogenase
MTKHVEGRPMSRRTFATAAAGVAVVGFHGGLGTWATGSAAAASAGPKDPFHLLTFNRGLDDRCKQLGGSQYPIGAIHLGTQDWAVHDGEQWSRLRDAKRRFDPANTLASGPDVLGVR